ncbi:MAG: alpha/beta hydrolase [Candidatus Buchananbacteria bacterium]|nr:alpha/beta hydrolase [Candidatus Buchananbacteria bacterium]
MTTKKISFKNRRGQRIVGLLTIPKGTPPFPAVIVCHGFKGYKEQLHLKTLAQEISRRGFVVLRFDFTSGVGESDGLLEDIKFSDELEDLRSAIDYLSNSVRIVDKRRIGLAGHSLGGQLIFHYASSDNRVKALAGLAGSYIRGRGMTGLERQAAEQIAGNKKTSHFYTTSKRTGKKFKIKIGFYYDLLKHDTLKAASEITIPALLLHGTKDSTVRIDSSKKVYRLVRGEKRLVLVPGAPHTWRGKSDPGHKYQRIINPIVADWFQKYV